MAGILQRFYCVTSEIGVFLQVIGQSERAQYDSKFTHSQTLWAELRRVQSRLTALQCRVYNIMRMHNVPIPEVTVSDDTIASLSTRHRVLRFRRDFTVMYYSAAMFTDMSVVLQDMIRSSEK